MGKRKAPNKDHKFCPFCGSSTDRYFSLEEIAQQTSTSVESWRTRVKNREINYIKIGKSVRISHTTLGEFIVRMPALTTATITNI